MTDYVSELPKTDDELIVPINVSEGAQRLIRVSIEEELPKSRVFISGYRYVVHNFRALVAKPYVPVTGSDEIIVRARPNIIAGAAAKAERYFLST